MSVILNGSDLTIEEVASVALNWPESSSVELGQDARQLILRMRKYIDENWLGENAPAIYGINTGLGPLMDVRVGHEDLMEFQKHIIDAHSGGIGPAFDEDETRAIMLLRVNALAKGNSGMRVEVLDRLIEMLNKGVHPVIPSQGSVGASGDLAPLAHMVAAMIGHEEAEAKYKGKTVSARIALSSAGMSETFVLHPGDAVALINGSTVSLGSGVLSLIRAEELSLVADCSVGMTVEAVRGQQAAFDGRIQQLRPYRGQQASAEMIRGLLNGSERATTKARAIKLHAENRSGEFNDRLHDSYAIRCAPQVHGTVRENLSYARHLLTVEINAATDNPLIFENENGGYDVLSGGNFHGEPIGFACDLISMSVSELGAISERRSFRMLDPNLSFGLPPNLVGGSLGINSGFAVTHCSASALASENKFLSIPSVIDSIPAKMNQEDHVSMCTYSAKKLKQVLTNVEVILGVELLLASQAIDVTHDQLGSFSLGEGTKQVYDLVRKAVPAMYEDRFASRQMKDMADLVNSGAIIKAFPKYSQAKSL